MNSIRRSSGESPRPEQGTGWLDPLRWNWARAASQSASLARRFFQKLDAYRTGPGGSLYDQRLSREIMNFRDVKNVHDLPDIFHYWSQKYLLPKFQELGIPGIVELFVRYIQQRCIDHHQQVCLVASLGAGNCDTEIAIARQLLAIEVKNFRLECLDVNPHMLARAKEAVAGTELSDYLHFIETDVKGWRPASSYGVVIANQSLHHFQELELLFQKVRGALDEEGVFVVSDVIGRNGHMRWPEALDVVHHIWETMPDRYKYNHLLHRFEKMYENWDCSVGGFEGIRAQDILPLLVNIFQFELFLAYGNIIDIFVDRAFGHNFDPNNEEDLRFIDQVAQLDDQLLEAGKIKPTHLIAAMRGRSVSKPRIYRHFAPDYCIRTTDLVA